MKTKAGAYVPKTEPGKKLYQELLSDIEEVREKKSANNTISGMFASMEAKREKKERLIKAYNRAIIKLDGEN